MPEAPRPERPLTCSQCGQPDAHVIGGEVLCPACCHERGSCGAGEVERVDPNALGRGEESARRTTKPSL